MLDKLTTTTQVRNIPRQYVKVKTLVWLKKPVKDHLLRTMWITQSDTLDILRGILKIAEEQLPYIEITDWLEPDQEIPISIFIQDTKIPSDIKQSISSLFNEIIFAKRLRLMTYKTALAELEIYKNQWWRVTQPIEKTMKILQKWIPLRAQYIRLKPKSGIKRHKEVPRRKEEVQGWVSTDLLEIAKKNASNPHFQGSGWGKSPKKARRIGHN